MRRQFVILLAMATALTVMGLGLAIGASAKGDELSAVRALTARFQSVAQAERAGYAPFYICTEQPGVGTMGQHFVKGSLVDGVADPHAARGPRLRADPKRRLTSLSRSSGSSRRPAPHGARRRRPYSASR